MINKIYINASDVAAACGLNPYQTREQLISGNAKNSSCYNKLMDECGNLPPVLYTGLDHAAVNCSAHANDSLVEKFELLKHETLLLKNELHKYSKTDSLADDTLADLDNKYKLAKRKKAEFATKVCLSACIESDDMTVVNNTEKCLKEAFPKDLCVGAVNVGRGLHHEAADFKTANDQHRFTKPCRVMYAHVCSGAFESRDYNITIGGICDGLSSDRVLELKRRRNRLFYRIKEYEKVQCFAYMYIYKRKLCDLVETYGDKQKVYSINWDDMYWNTVIIPLLHKFASVKILR